VQQPPAIAVQHSAGGQHLGIEESASRQQAVEEPAMPVGPLHHRSDTESVGSTLPSYFCPISYLVNFISSHVVPFSARFEPFSLTSPTDIGTTGTTNNGSRKDGFKTFTAQIVIKKADYRPSRGKNLRPQPDGQHLDCETFGRAQRSWRSRKESRSDTLSRDRSLYRGTNNAVLGT
jgi:hypothetical protein